MKLLVSLRISLSVGCHKQKSQYIEKYIFFFFSSSSTDENTCFFKRIFKTEFFHSSTLKIIRFFSQVISTISFQLLISEYSMFILNCFRVTQCSRFGYRLQSGVLFVRDCNSRKPKFIYRR